MQVVEVMAILYEPQRLTGWLGGAELPDDGLRTVQLP